MQLQLFNDNEAMSEVNLGQLITTPQQRDAIHVAVAPVIAAEAVEPGQHIQLNHEGKACSGKEPIGIVDPYLKQDVMPGDQFWLFLYPKTVTNLRHDWSHPAFERKTKLDENAAIAWLTEFAKEGKYTYGELIAEAKNSIADSDYYISLGTDTPTRWYDEIETFWKHIETVTGLKVPDKTHAPFSCAC